jgi:hypothetical protein
LNVDYNKGFGGERRKSETNNPGALYIFQKDAKACATIHTENATFDRPL